MTANATTLNNRIPTTQSTVFSANELNPMTPRGWRSGVSNLYRKEAYTWLRTRMGLIQLAMWALIINGLMTIIISDAGEGIAEGESLMTLAIDPYIGITALFTSIGVAVLAMGAIVGEKTSGTAAWVLSAPVSRPGFLMSKLATLSVGSIVTMIVVPGVIVFFQMTYLPTTADIFEVPVLQWLGVIGTLALATLFYLSLTLAMGTVFNARGAVVGIPIGVVFLGMFLGGSLPEFVFNLTPWALGSLAQEIADETTAVTSLVPVFATMVWIVVLTVASFWRFQREEL